LKKELETQTTLRKEFEVKVAKLMEKKNNLLMFKSQSQRLSDEEIAFRELIKNINPELTILNLKSKRLFNKHIKYLSQCEFLNNLISLDLLDNPSLTLEGFKYLEECTFITKLTDFKLQWCIVGQKERD